MYGHAWRKDTGALSESLANDHATYALKQHAGIPDHALYPTFSSPCQSAFACVCQSALQSIQTGKSPLSGSQMCVYVYMCVCAHAEKASRDEIQRHMQRCAAQLTVPQLADVLIHFLSHKHTPTHTSSTNPLVALPSSSHDSQQGPSTPTNATTSNTQAAQQSLMVSSVPGTICPAEQALVPAQEPGALQLYGAESEPAAAVKEAAFQLVKRLKEAGATNGEPIL